MQTSAHSLTIDQVLDQLHTSREEGLTTTEATKRLQKYGPNSLPDSSTRHPLTILLHQLNSLMVYILFVAAIISWIYHHYLDVYVILGVIVINTIIGFVQEYRAEKSISALKSMIVQKAKVMRDGDIVQILAQDLVPGDIIILDAGDKIPADARLIHLKDLQTIESALTGESMPIDKDPTELSEDSPVSDRKNMVFMGTSVARGSAHAVVTGTGTHTQLGLIATDLEEIDIAPSHFKRKTDTLAKQMAGLAMFTTLVTFIVGYFIRGFGFEEVFMFTIATLVAGIPESLPVILIIVLAISAHRMAKNKAIVRNLPSTETLAVADVIITDKTGTLTQNQMTATRISFPYQELVTVIDENDQLAFHQHDQAFPTDNPQLQKILDIASLCHGVKEHTETDENGNTHTSIIGDPTEQAIANLAKKAGVDAEFNRERIHKFDDLPFQHELRWRSAMIYNHVSDTHEIFTVAAGEQILDQCTTYLRPDGSLFEFTPEDLEEVKRQIESMTSDAMRIMILAFRTVDKSYTTVENQNIKNMTYVGIVGLVDPPRPDVSGAIAKARSAGIRVVMATGDHPNTAAAIAREIGLIEDRQTHEQNSSSSNFPLTITGAEFTKLSEEDAVKAALNINVFARMTPDSKYKLAKLVQSQGHVIAMTGDGVNDAPALKQADIGISMGQAGTDVAREASDIVLADDNFATIVSAIEEGRTQFRNIRRTSFYLVLSNISQSFALLIFLILGLPLPLLPKQILWINLVTCGINDLSLATEPIHSDVLKNPPKNQNENILNRTLVPFAIIISIIMTAFSLLAYHLLIDQSVEMARTGIFVIVAMTQLFNVLNMRSLKAPISSIGMFSNRNVNLALVVSFLLLLAVIYAPGLSTIFEFAPLPIANLLLAIVFSSSVFFAMEAYKYLTHNKRKSTS